MDLFYRASRSERPAPPRSLSRAACRRTVHIYMWPTARAARFVRFHSRRERWRLARLLGPIIWRVARGCLHLGTKMELARRRSYNTAWTWIFSTTRFTWLIHTTTRSRL